MSLIKKSVLWFLFFVILSLLIIAGISLAIGNSLKYGNVKVPVKDFVKNNVFEKFSKAELNSEYEQAVSVCNNHLQDGVSVERDGVNVTLKCAEVNNTNFDNLLNIKIDQMMLESYNKSYNYTCPVFLCFTSFSKDRVQSFFSSDSQKFFTNQAYYFFALTIVLLIFSLLFFESKRRVFLYTGALLIISSLVLLLIDLFFSQLPDQIFQLVSVFASEAKRIFMVLFPIGIICVIMGIVAVFIHQSKGKKK
jgi:hypothetical protein